MIVAGWSVVEIDPYPLIVLDVNYRSIHWKWLSRTVRAGSGTAVHVREIAALEVAGIELAHCDSGECSVVALPAARVSFQ